MQAVSFMKMQSTEMRGEPKTISTADLKSFC